MVGPPFAPSSCLEKTCRIGLNFGIGLAGLSGNDGSRLPSPSTCRPSAGLHQASMLPHSMKRIVWSLLVGYGAVLAVLGLLAQRLAPDFAGTSLLAGLVGGGVCALLGVLGLLEKPRRGWSILAMSIIGLLLLTQAVHHWMPSGATPRDTRSVALITTAMFLATVATLMMVAYSGIASRAGTTAIAPTASLRESRTANSTTHPKSSASRRP